MAIYAADIRIGVVNKNVLTSLNKLLNTSLSISKRLNRELTKLGKVNKIKIDNKQALASLDAIQKRINKINSTPIAPRTRGRGGGGVSGGGAGGGGLRGSAMRAATASAALIPGISPFAVGAGAGALGGGGLAGAAVGVGVAGGVQAAVATAQFANQSAIAAAEVKKMKVALQGVTPDYDAYSTALDNVKTLSDKYAISQRNTLTNFTKLQASASASGFSVDEVTEAYEGLTAGTIATGGNQEKLNGIMLAASQVFAKGKVAAEEIRGQISERLPGAMAIFADSMGVSGKALDKLLQEGKVTMQDFLNFTRRLSKVHGETANKMVKDSSNAGQRLAKEWDDLMINMGTVFQPIGAAIQDTLTSIISEINTISEKLIKLFGLTNQTKIANLEEDKTAIDARINALQNKTKTPSTKGAFRRFMGNAFEGLKGLGSAGSQFSISPSISPDQIAASQAQVERGGLPPKFLETDKQENLLDILINKSKELGDQIDVLKGKKKEENKETALANELDKAKAAQWKKIENQLNLQIQYQKDLNEGGKEYADTQKMINDLLDKFPDKSEEINKLVKALKDVEKQGKSAKAVLNDWLDELEERLKELKNPMQQFKTLVEAAGDSFQSDFKEMIRGTKSVGDAMVNMFNRIADAYLDMVAEMIAAQAKMALVKFVGSMFGGGGSGGMSWSSSVNAPSMNYGYENLSSSVSQFRLASGGYVDRPTNALIGDNGPEYVLRDDQMAGALARYASGQRGQSVIPGGSYSDQPRGGGGDVTVAYTGPTLNFNGDEYVPKSSVPEIINAAAKQGASAGQAKALSSLKNSRSARSRVGI